MTGILLSEIEQAEYCLGAALLDIIDDRPRKGLAWEISDELARDLPTHGGLHVPYSIRAGLDTATATKGQELKFTQPITFIDALRKRAIVIKGGATVLEGLVGNVAIPRGNGVATAFWATTENPLSDVAESNLLLNQVAMSPKELIGTTSFSRQLLALSASSSSVDGLVKNDLARVHASTIDLAALNGTGATGQPTGVLQQASVALIAFGTNGTLPTWPLITSFEKTVAVADGDVVDGAYIVTPETRDRLRTIDRATTGTASGWFILSDRIGNGTDSDINGYQVLVSNQLPKNLVKGSSGAVCHAMIFGAMSEIIVGFWGGFEIVPDPFRLKKQGMIELTSYALVDIAVRHPAAFAVSKDVLP